MVQRFQLADALDAAPLLGAIGPLQFDVARYRLQLEYDVACSVEPAPWSITRWVHPASDEQELRSLYLGGIAIARDDRGALALLFESDWRLRRFQDKNAGIKLSSQPWSRDDEQRR